MFWGVQLGQRCFSSRLAFFLFMVFCTSLLFSFPTIAESKALVVYPKVKEPYSTIFNEMVEGFRFSFSGTFEELAVNGSGEEQISSQIGNIDPDVVVALSSMTLKAIEAANISTPLLVGAVGTAPGIGIYGGVSMIPGADIYLEQMLRLFPNVESVFFVFDPERDQELQQNSRLFLEKRRIKSQAIPAKDIREAAIAYKRFLQEAGSGDVVWIYPNSKLINSSLLSEILDKAWRKKLVVFSSNPVHVKRGALFALYPDNNGIGRRLGELANNLYVNKSERSGIEPLAYVKLVVNARTSDHLGLTFEDDVRQKMDLILPGR